jgi:hypothetical protein
LKAGKPALAEAIAVATRELRDRRAPANVSDEGSAD